MRADDFHNGTMYAAFMLPALGGGRRTVDPNLGWKSVAFAFHNCHQRQLPRICVIVVRTVQCNTGRGEKRKGEGGGEGGGEERRGEERRKEMGR